MAFLIWKLRYKRGGPVRSFELTYILAIKNLLNKITKLIGIDIQQVMNCTYM